MARAKAPATGILKQFAQNERFRAFEREVVEDLNYEIEERNGKYEDARQQRERKARRKRLKKQASLTS